MIQPEHPTREQWHAFFLRLDPNMSLAARNLAIEHLEKGGFVQPTRPRE